MEWILGKKSRPLSREALDEKILESRRVWIDVGCGDGKLFYRLAQKHPQDFFIGLDAARENLAPVASKARRSPKKGGRANLIYLIVAAETLPGKLSGIAHRVVLTFPWGSLLRGLLRGDETLCKGLRGCLRGGGELHLLFNESLYGDEALVERLGLPKLGQEQLYEVVIPGLEGAGFQAKRCERIPNAGLSLRTSWGRRLTDSHPEGTSWQVVLQAD